MSHKNAPPLSLSLTRARLVSGVAELMATVAGRVTAYCKYVGPSPAVTLSKKWKDCQSLRAEIEPGRRRAFPHPSRLALGPTQPPAQLAADLFPRSKAAGAWR